MSTAARLTGRIKTALVFGEGDNARAVISSVVAHTCEYMDSGRIRFVGPVVFGKSIDRHIEDILLPLVDRVLISLGLHRKNFEVSVVNLGATSALDLGVRISGFSADMSVFLALLSVSLGMTIPEDMVSTGHIASSDGDISAVKAIPAKLSAALRDKSINCFVYPALDGDRSLAELSPCETENAEIALINAKGQLKVTAVGNIADLIQAVFTDEAIVLAALQQDFFDMPCPEQADSNPITRSVRFLTKNNESRFWDVLERYLMAGANEEAKRLLLGRSQFHMRRKTYPKEFGRKLMQLLRSLPPTTRRLKTTFPLLSTAECVSMTQFAAESDFDDIRLLYDAAIGREVSKAIAIKEVRYTDDRRKTSSAEMALDTVLTQIDSEFLAKTIGLPIDTARTTYMLDSVTVDSQEQFYDTISAFYLHMQRHACGVSDSTDLNSVRDDAIAFVERTFADQGGIEAALAEARDAIYGGMRFILDAMTEQFKTERQIKHVNRRLKEALDPLDSRSRISFMGALLKRLGPHLPEEVRSAPPERFAKHYEIIVKTYVKSLGKVKELFRAL